MPIIEREDGRLLANQTRTRLHPTHGVTVTAPVMKHPTSRPRQLNPPVRSNLIMSRPSITHADAMTEHTKAAETLAQWQAHKAESQAELGRLDQHLTETLATNPDQAGPIQAQIRAGQDRLDLADRAIPGATDRVTAAARAVVAAEAAALQPAIDKARRALADHDAKTAELLAALEAHAGCVYRAEQRPHDPWPGRPIVGKLAISERLAHQIQPLERQQAILTAAAAGQSVRDTFPGITVDELPASLHPRTGIAPAVEFEDQIASREQTERDEAERQQRQAELDELLTQFPGVVGDLVAKAWQASDNDMCDLGFALGRTGYRLPEGAWGSIQRIGRLAGFKTAHEAATTLADSLTPAA